MSFTGYSNLQATQISAASGRVTDLESRATVVEGRATTLEGRATGLEGRASAVEGRATGVEGRATALEGRATALETDLSSFHTTYDTYTSANDTKNTQQDGRLTAVEGRATALENDLSTFQTTYTSDTSTNDAKNTEQDGRLTAVEGRATALEGRVDQVESNITVQVSNAITTQLAQTTFDTLKDEIADTNTALSAAIATKVAQVTQTQVDNLQNEQIATKVSITSFQNTIDSLNTSINSTFSGQEDRFFAVEEFIKAFLNTYTITLPSGSNYAYTALPQGLSYTPSDVTILDKEADGNNWKINFQLSVAAYNALITNGGDVSFQLTSSGGAALPSVVVNYSTINSSTRKGVATITNSRSGSSWTLGSTVNALLRSKKGTTISNVAFNASTLTVYVAPYTAPSGISGATFSGFVIGSYGSSNKAVMLAGLITNNNVYVRTYIKLAGETNFSVSKDNLRLTAVEDSTLDTYIGTLYPGKKGYNMAAFTNAAAAAGVSVKVEFYNSSNLTNKIGDYTFISTDLPISLV